MSRFKIDSNIISKDGPLYFIADIGANHDGKINRAFKLIELAKEAGAHAAKFQNFTASKIVSKKGFDNLGKQLSHQSNWEKSVYDTYADASISLTWTHKLKEKCNHLKCEKLRNRHGKSAQEYLFSNHQLLQLELLIFSMIRDIQTEHMQK